MASGHRAIDGKPERTTTEAASNNWINAVTEASAGLENFVLPLWNIGVTPQTPWRISSVHLWNMRGAPQALHRQGLPQRASPPEAGSPPARKRWRGGTPQSPGHPSSLPPDPRWRRQQQQRMFGEMPLGTPACKRHRPRVNSVRCLRQLHHIRKGEPDLPEHCKQLSACTKASNGMHQQFRPQ